jgi:hypothetical protein
MSCLEGRPSLRVSIVLCVVSLLIAPSCAWQSQVVRLQKSQLRARCDIVRRAANLSYESEGRTLLESIPTGECARENAHIAGKVAIRVGLERIPEAGPPIRTPFFQAGETCSWPDLVLVGPTFEEIDKSVDAVVTLLFFEEDRDGVPFRVGVETRGGDADKAAIQMSLCGTIDGRVVWSEGRWQISPNPEGSD